MNADIDTMEEAPQPSPAGTSRSLPLRPEPRGMKFTYASGAKPLSGYTIKRGIGVGGFGEVYFALSDAGKEVALKRVQRNLDVELRGVSHCLNLKHPNLISLFDVRYDDGGQAWVVMEYVAGASLRTVLDEAAPRGIDERETRRWLAAVAAGVAHLHESGIVHRDLKPGNLFDDDGIVKIGDYGLSKFISCSRRDGHTESVGTFHYMAPEVGRGNYGREIDIYALGIILYEMLTGTVPFDGESSHEIVMKHLTANPDLSGLAEPYRSVIWQALQKDPTARQQTVQQMVRPLGIELDPHGLARIVSPAVTAPAAAQVTAQATGQRNTQPTARDGEVERWTGSADMRFSPVTDRSREPNATGGEASGVGSATVDAETDLWFGEVRHHSPPAGQLPGSQLATAGGAAATVLGPQEPLAHSLHSGLFRARQWWAGLEPFPGTRVVLMILGLALLLLNVQWLLPLLTFLAVLYVPYYIIRAMTLSVTRQPSFAEAHRVAVARQQRPRPLTARQWRQRKRSEIAAKPSLVRVAELGGSLTTAGFATAVLAGLAGMIALWRVEPTATAIAPFAWSATVALLAAGAVLVLSKVWERDPSARMPRRLVMLGAGAAVGAAAYGLADFLMLPLADGVARDVDLSELPVALYDSGGLPLLPAWMAHFAVLLAALRWWRPADPLRRSRLSLWAVAVAVVGEWALHQVLPVAQPWGMLTAGLIAAVVQISAPWEDPRQRFGVSAYTPAETV